MLVNLYARKMEKHTRRRQTSSVVFMDLSKVFDTINHVLVIAKLDTYGFSNYALLFMVSN